MRCLPLVIILLLSIGLVAADHEPGHNETNSTEPLEPVTFRGHAPADGEDWSAGQDISVIIDFGLRDIDGVQMTIDGESVRSVLDGEEDLRVRLDEEVELEPGEHTVRVSVLQAQEEIASTSWNINAVESDADTIPPFITVISPTDGTTSERTFTLELTTSEQATCTCEGSCDGSFESDGSIHSMLIEDAQGDTATMTISCADAAGNVRTREVNVEFNDPQGTNRPPVWTNEPADSQHAYAPKILIEFAATDPDGTEVSYDLASASDFVFFEDGKIAIEAPEGFGGPILMTLRASDQIDTIEKIFTVTIIAGAAPPTNNTNGTNTTPPVTPPANNTQNDTNTTTPDVNATDQPPARSEAQPSGTLTRGTTEATLSLATNEAATCRFSGTQGAAFADMTAFNSTGGTAHSSALTGLTNGGSYNYYVKCRDEDGNTNPDDFTISFSVQSESSSSGGGGGGSSRRRSGGGGGGSISTLQLNWTCGPWSVCVNGTQNQTCTRGTQVMVNTTECTVIPVEDETEVLIEEPLGVPLENAEPEVTVIDEPDAGLNAITGQAASVPTVTSNYRRPLQWMLIGWGVVMAGLLGYFVYRKYF